MKKSLKIVFITLTIICLSILFNTSVFAANFNVEVNCTGRTIKMTSQTPDLTWKIQNILPGQKDETTLTIQNVGVKKVDVSLKAEIESGEDVTKVLDLKIIKLFTSDNQNNEVYSGKYSDLKDVNVSLQPNEKAVYKLVTTLPIETGNEYQGKECVVKLKLVASGDEDVPKDDKPQDPPAPVEDKPVENPPEDVPADVPQEKPSETPGKLVTDKVEAPQTGESIAIFVVAGVLVVAFIVLIVTFLINKSEEKKK